jgi:hypothetical protein
MSIGSLVRSEQLCPESKLNSQCPSLSDVAYARIFFEGRKEGRKKGSDELDSRFSLLHSVGKLQEA